MQWQNLASFWTLLPLPYYTKTKQGYTTLFKDWNIGISFISNDGTFFPSKILAFLSFQMIQQMAAGMALRVGKDLAMHFFVYQV